MSSTLALSPKKCLPLQLIVEGGTAIAIFIRCFADKRGIDQELKRMHYMKFPRGLLAAISVIASFTINRFPYFASYLA